MEMCHAFNLSLNLLYPKLHTSSKKIVSCQIEEKGCFVKSALQVHVHLVPNIVKINVILFGEHITIALQNVSTYSKSSDKGMAMIP